MELLGSVLAIWMFCGFLLAAILAMLCRGFGKATEMNTEFLANMGFFWSILPVGIFAASGYFPFLDLSDLAPFAYVLGAIPLAVIMTQRTTPDHAPPIFGHDRQGRVAVFACTPHEVLTTLLYSLLAFMVCTIFLWDELYR